VAGKVTRWIGLRLDSIQGRRYGPWDVKTQEATVVALFLVRALPTFAASDYRLGVAVRVCRQSARTAW